MIIYSINPVIEVLLAYEFLITTNIMDKHFTYSTWYLVVSVSNNLPTKNNSDFNINKLY